MVVSSIRVECPLWIGSEVLTQVEEFKYLGVLFTSGGRMEQDIDRETDAASAVVLTLVKRD